MLETDLAEINCIWPVLAAAPAVRAARTLCQARGFDNKVQEHRRLQLEDRRWGNLSGGRGCAGELRGRVSMCCCGNAGKASTCITDSALIFSFSIAALCIACSSRSSWLRIPSVRVSVRATGDGQISRLVWKSMQSCEQKQQKSAGLH